jgi:hypothetical protein
MAVEVVRGVVQEQSVEAIAIGGRHADLQAGDAVLESGSSSRFKGIIRVADLDEDGTGSEQIIELAVKNILAVVERENFWSIAMPVLGIGPDLPESHALARMLLTIYEARFMGNVVIVRNGQPDSNVSLTTA